MVNDSGDGGDNYGGGCSGGQGGGSNNHDGDGLIKIF